MGKPGIVFGYIKKIARREIEYRQRRLTQAIFELSFKCNLRCEMCRTWCDNDPRWRNELSLSEWLELINDLAVFGCRRLHLSGGEPTIVSGFVDIIKRAKNKGMYVSLNTNGVELESIAPEICTYTDAVYLSIDAPDERHDKIRGVHNAFQKALKGTEAVVDYKHRHGLSVPIINMRAVISKSNFDCIQGLIDLADRIGVNILSLQYVSVSTREAVENSIISNKCAASNRFTIDDRSRLLIDKKEVRVLRDQLDHIPKTMTVIVQSEPMKSLSDESFVTGMFPTKRCTNVSNVIMILPDGSTTICGHLDNYSMGNVREDSVSDIWHGAARRQLINHLQERLFPVCYYCTFFSNTLTPGQLIRIPFSKLG